MDDTSFPQAGTAAVHVLHAGYAREEAGGERVASTITLIQDGNVVVIVDTFAAHAVCVIAAPASVVFVATRKPCSTNSPVVK